MPATLNQVMTRNSDDAMHDSNFTLQRRYNQDSVANQLPFNTVEEAPAQEESKKVFQQKTTDGPVERIRLASAATGIADSQADRTAYTSEMRQPVTAFGSNPGGGSIVGGDNITDNATKDLQDYADMPAGDLVSEQMKYRYNNPKNVNLAS